MPTRGSTPLVSPAKDTIVLDVDGALINFLSPYVAYIRSLGHEQVVMSEIKSFYFPQDFGFTQTQSKDFFWQFVRQGGFRNLWPYPGAVALLAYLKQEGYKVVLATNVQGSQGQNDRLANLADLGIEYDEIHFTSEKHKIVNESGAHIVLEDHPDAIEKCLAETNAVVAMPQFPYNAHLKHERLINLGEHPDALSKLVEHLRTT